MKSLPPSPTVDRTRRSRLAFILALGAVLILATIVRLHGLTAVAIWCDEASSIITSRYPLPDLWFHAAHDVHPPFYYVLLHLWMAMFGEGLFSIRLLSAIPGIATVLVGALLVRQVASPKAALLAGLLLALFPFAVRYSQEVRMYSWLTLLLLSATLALMHWLRNPERKGWLALYVLLMTASLYTHYFTIFCALVHWLHVGALSLRHEGQRPATYRPLRRAPWWLANIAIALLFMPWVPKLYDQLTHLPQLEAGGDVGWIAPVTLWSLATSMWEFWTLSDGQSMPRAVYFLLPLTVIALAGVVVRTDRSPQRSARFLVLYTFAPMVAVFLLSLISPLLVERYLMFAAIGLPMLVALAIAQLWRKSRLLAMAVLVTTLAVDRVGLNEIYRIDEPQFDQLVDYVNRHYQPGDTVVISDLFWYFTYVYYNTTPVVPQLLTLPKSEGGAGRPNAYGFGTLVDAQGPHIYVDELTQLPRQDHRIWLVGSAQPPDDFYAIPAQWQLLEDRKVGDNELRLYQAHWER
ncbi:glycosyltransferase family 39 protein [Pseudomonas baltica]|uniref:glycosyltransferase family 39 protein n=1 Tax=Pseudomonas baltica TaxID=2762576 RepID=UPI0028A16F35|nr:glycosyltransferase family 39 protein [Pseudomonas baltica]